MTGMESAAPDHRSAEVIARVNRLELRVDDLDQLFPLPGQTPAPGGAEEDGDALGQWVTSFFAVIFGRSLGGEYRWCPRWVEHPEAVFRLRALRRAFLVLQEDSKIGDAVWLREHLDPQLGVLLSARGPFALCSQDRHDLLPDLPIETPPGQPSRLQTAGRVLLREQPQGSDAVARRVGDPLKDIERRGVRAMTRTEDALREWARGSYAVEAGVELLIRHGRAVYAGAPWIVRVEDRAGVDVPALLDGARVWSGGEQRVVRIAASLIEGVQVDLAENLSALDRSHLDLVLAAVAHAAGFDREGELVLGEHELPEGFSRTAGLHP